MTVILYVYTQEKCLRIHSLNLLSTPLLNGGYTPSKSPKKNDIFIEKNCLTFIIDVTLPKNNR
jgi:hypothetical protein